MLNQQNPIETKAWESLIAHYDQLKDIHIKQLFTENPNRFAQFSASFEDILLDYSKNRITQETLDLLVGLANECGLKKAIDAMFSGQKINQT